jgi:hypothetical protein
MHKVNNKNDMRKALQLADEWDYNKKTGKIPVGIFYQKQEQSLEEKWPQLKKLMKKGVGWKKC